MSTAPCAAQLTLSGRALAQQRRQAMALQGKAGAKAAMVAAAARTAPAAPAVAAAQVATPIAALSAARLRRQALSHGGKASGWVTAGQRTRGAELSLPADSREALAAQPSAAAGCRCAVGCTADDARPAQTRPAADSTDDAALLRRARVAAAPAPGREAAMQRRQAQHRGAAGQGQGARPSGRVRPARAEVVAPEVGFGHTLAGRPVTGTMVDSTRKLTGTEAGQCRPVTGTEYLGREPFQALCGTRPAPGPAKVAETRTLREQRVTGTELGNSPRHTGDEPGACKPVTGTEYLGLEHFAGACGTQPPEARPHKVSVMSTPKGQTVSGAPMERSAKVTGDERGAARSLTGTGFQSPASASADVPPKVGTVPTRGGGTVTGTEVGPSARVTGDERGACCGVTGSDYVARTQQQAVCAAPETVAAVAKVGVDQTWRGQSVTGTQVGRGQRVTGDEPGACASISGTPYLGRQQQGAFCTPEQQLRQLAALPQRTTIPAARVSGDRPGAGGPAMTGDERGACHGVSGTPYVGRDNGPAACPPAASRYVPRAAVPAVELPPAPLDFSIVPPARQMQQRAAERDSERAVTGSGMGTQRITGPVNKAGGMVTGTPEFRHHEAAAPAIPATAEATSPAAARLSGDGSQHGFRVSGDAWQGLGRVTGTEGASVLARNPTQRGQPRGMGMNAMRWREEIERPEVAPSPVTGSSGNTLKGAAITVSGGARA